MTALVRRPWLQRRLSATLVLAAVLTTSLLGIGAALLPSQAAEYYPAPASGYYTIDGRGYGHGHGLSQYGTQGAATKGLGAAEILEFYYPGTQQTDIGNPPIRVQLTATVSGDIRVDSTTGLGMTVRDVASGMTASGPDGSYRVLTSGSTQSILRWDGATWAPLSLGGSGSYQGPLEFATSDGVTVWAQGKARNYRGSLRVVRTTAATSVAVNHVTMEDYLRGVVPRESPGWFLPAALQAQSVAARSYAWWDVQTPSSAAWDICDTTACQVYGGRNSFTTSGGWKSEEFPSTTNAVDSTKGIALYYGGKPAFTQFSSSNGGEASAGSQPYLLAFTDPYDGVPPQNTGHSWSATLSSATIESLYPSIGKLTGLRIQGREGRGVWGGRITTVDVVGTAATVKVTSPRFGLKSSWWKPRSQHNPFGDVNDITVVASGKARFQGWAIDPDTSASVGLHVYVDGAWGGAFTADVSRPDVGAAYPATGNLHGFDFTLTLGQGRRSVCIYALNLDAGDDNTSLGCRQVTAGMPPVGDVNSVTVGGGRARVLGWALDPDVPDPIMVHAYVNGVWAGQASAALSRADVGAAYPAAGPGHGFDLSVPLKAGRNDVCLYAIDSTPGSINPQLGCRVATLRVDPLGDINQVIGRASTVDLSGWALDPDTTDPIAVHVYVDGRWGRALTADVARNDVAAAYPDSGPLHGFSASLPLAPGRHEVCAYAINVARGSVNTPLGCRTAEVGVRPAGDLNAVRASGLSAQITGWALDPASTTPLDVHIYVDQRWGTAVTADVARADIGRAYPTSGPNHGYTASVPLAVGNHQVCAYAINPVPGGVNPLLGCRTVTIAASAADPRGNLEGATVTGGDVTVSGWVIDPDEPATSVDLHVYVDDRWGGALRADADRPDVAAAYPGYGPAHGFSFQRTLAPGRHTVCVYAINLGQGSGNPLLGCRSVEVTA